MVFTGGKCRYGRQEILFSLGLLYPRRSKTQGELLVQKAEEKLAYSQSAKQDSSIEALNLFHIVRHHSPALSGFANHLILLQSGGIVESSVFFFI